MFIPAPIYHLVPKSKYIKINKLIPTVLSLNNMWVVKCLPLYPGRWPHSITHHHISNTPRLTVKLTLLLTGLLVTFYTIIRLRTSNRHICCRWYQWQRTPSYTFGSWSQDLSQRYGIAKCNQYSYLWKSGWWLEILSNIFSNVYLEFYTNVIVYYGATTILWLV